MTEEHDEISSGVRAFLKYPFVYLFFQFLMNSHAKYKMYLDRFLTPVHGKRILDIGCGCADILTVLPHNVEYVGYDVNSRYIEYARRKFGHRGTFYNQRVNNIVIEDNLPFDIVLADGILHHLSDEEAAELFTISHKALYDTGFLFTADPTLVENQGFVSRRISMMDRGRHVRPPQEYQRIAQKVFRQVEVHVVDKVSNRPQTGCFLKCYKIK